MEGFPRLSNFRSQPNSSFGSFRLVELELWLAPTIVRTESHQGQPDPIRKLGSRRGRLVGQITSPNAILGSWDVVTATLYCAGIGKVRSTRFQGRGPRGVLRVGNISGCDMCGSFRGILLASVAALPTRGGRVASNGVARCLDGFAVYSGL